MQALMLVRIAQVWRLLRDRGFVRPRRQIGGIGQAAYPVGGRLHCRKGPEHT
jgi:hypothetical protein